MSIACSVFNRPKNHKYISLTCTLPCELDLASLSTSYSSSVSNFSPINIKDRNHILQPFILAVGSLAQNCNDDNFDNYCCVNGSSAAQYVSTFSFLSALLTSHRSFPHKSQKTTSTIHQLTPFPRPDSPFQSSLSSSLGAASSSRSSRYASRLSYCDCIYEDPVFTTLIIQISPESVYLYTFLNIFDSPYEPNNLIPPFLNSSDPFTSLFHMLQHLLFFSPHQFIQFLPRRTCMQASKPRGKGLDPVLPRIGRSKNWGQPLPIAPTTPYPTHFPGGSFHARMGPKV